MYVPILGLFLSPVSVRYMVTAVKDGPNGGPTRESWYFLTEKDAKAKLSRLKDDSVGWSFAEAIDRQEITPLAEPKTIACWERP